MTSAPLTFSNRKSGAALMAVIWLIAILSLASISALRIISFDMEITSAKVHGSRALQLAEMGIAVASNPAVKSSDPLLIYTDEKNAEAYEAKIISEGNRFNINVILLNDDKPLMRSILIEWGLELDEAQALTDALCDWVDSDDNISLNGAEMKEYKKIGRINQPFNRPFYDLQEMSLVIGMDRVAAVKPDWRSWFTIWSGGGLDVNEAPAEMIAVAAETQLERAMLIPEMVAGPDGELYTSDDVPFKSAAEALEQIGISAEMRPDVFRRFSANDSTARLESIGEVMGVKRKIIVTVGNRASNPTLIERIEEIIP